MKKQKKEAPHFAGGRALKGHGAHDVENPIVVNQSAGYHSGRMVPKPTPLGGDQLPSGENGGGVGAGIEPAQPEPLMPRFLRGAGVPVYSAEAPKTPDAN